MEPQTDPELSGMAEVHSEEARIDHLSCLPPELLSDIFDLAKNTDYPLSRPLSKSTLPYFHELIYRQIRLGSFDSLVKLLDTVQSKPVLGDLILELDTSLCSSPPGASQILEQLLHQLPTLRSLKTFKIDSLPRFSASIPQNLPSRLTYFSYRQHQLSYSDFDALARFTGLKRLEIRFDSFEIEVSRPSSMSLVNVAELSLVHTAKPAPGAASEPWTAETAQYVDRFPNISHLILLDASVPRFNGLLSHLTQSVSTLKSLTLRSVPSELPYDTSCEEVLPRFVNLERLDVADGTITAALPAYLHLLSLIEGPRRLVSLEDLVLDFTSSVIGRRVDIHDIIENGRKLEDDGWFKPQFVWWEVENVRQLMAIGITNGVRITGSACEVLDFQEVIDLEERNRFILRTYHSKSLQDLQTHEEEEARNPRFPGLIIIDVATLDPDNLKLVKIDLPEEGWYQLTLE